MSEQETIEYWTHKINVAQKEDDKKHITSFGLILPMVEPQYCIPVADYKILLKHDIKLEGRWSCSSGSEAYKRAYKLPHLSTNVGYGTPVPGFYKIIRQEGNQLICYFNNSKADEFVEQDIYIHSHQLFAPYSEGSRDYLCEGDVLHVESIQLINNRYAVKWQIL